MAKIFAGLIAVVGWLSLVLQFALQMTNPVTPEPGVAERFIRFFSYFTVSTNIIVAVTLTAIAFFPRKGFGEFFSRPTVQAAVASYISIVGIIYTLFLRGTWNPQGWQSVADHLLHDVIPVAFVIYWFVFAPKNEITWQFPLKWLVYPSIYIVYSLIRGAFVSWYPYWFVDVTQLGYMTALTNTAFVVAVFAVIGFIYAGIAKAMSGTASPDVN
jgi:hypothetical protein